MSEKLKSALLIVFLLALALGFSFSITADDVPNNCSQNQDYNWGELVCIEYERVNQEVVTYLNEKGNKSLLSKMSAETMIDEDKIFIVERRFNDFYCWHIENYRYMCEVRN